MTTNTVAADSPPDNTSLTKDSVNGVGAADAAEGEATNAPKVEAASALDPAAPLPTAAESSAQARAARIAPIDSALAPMHALPAALLAIASGVLYWAAFPGIDVWPLAFICWAPLLIAIRGQRPRRALWLGLLQGLTCNVLGFYWLFGMLKSFSGFNDLLCGFFMLVLCAYQGGRMAFMAWLYGRAEKRGWPIGTVFACAFIASELVYPLLFPWYTGAQTHTVPLLMQLAEVGGPIAIGLALAGGSVAVAEAFWAFRDKRKIDRVRMAIAIGGPIVLVLWGAIRMPMVQRAIDAAPKARVGVVQGKIPLERGTDSTQIHRDEQAKLETVEPNMDLVVWSETAVDVPIPQEAIEPSFAALMMRGIGYGFQPPLRTPLLTGAVILRGFSKGVRGKVYNSAVLVEPNGKLEGSYDKTFLLAFGEYIPFGETFPALYEASKNSGHLTPGSSLESIPFGAHKITTLICYEDILPTFTNAAVRKGDPDLLVNMTNDAWFGKSTEPGIHLALAKFRAVEHRRYLVRATNTGVSAFVDPLGRSTGESPLFERFSEAGDVRWMRSTTIYEVIGDVPWWLATIAVVAMGLLRRQGRSVRFAWRNPA